MHTESPGHDLEHSTRMLGNAVSQHITFRSWKKRSNSDLNEFFLFSLIVFKRTCKLSITKRRGDPRSGACSLAYRTALHCLRCIYTRCLSVCESVSYSTMWKRSGQCAVRRAKDSNNGQLCTTCAVHECRQVGRPPFQVDPLPIPIMKQIAQVFAD